jgi:outer membrane protein assembly factor BamE
MMDKIFLTICLGMNVLVSACAVYKVDIQQGNVVTQEMIAQLELFMPSKKVRFIMGTPLIVDVFHQQRWDYLYSWQPGRGERVQRHIALFFDEKDRLIQVTGDIKVGQRRTQQRRPLPSELDEQPIL